MQNVWKTYDDITNDVILETLCQRLLFLEYFELKNNWQPEWRFPKNAFKNDLPLS